jgi:hypothetical protein
MSDMWIVVIGAVSVLSALAIVTFAARPSEFRSKFVPESPVQWSTVSAEPVAIAQSSPVEAVKLLHIPARPNPAPPVVPVLEASAQGLEYLTHPAVRTIKRGASDQESVWAKPPARNAGGSSQTKASGPVEPRETLPI